MPPPPPAPSDEPSPKGIRCLIEPPPGFLRCTCIGPHPSCICYPIETNLSVWILVSSSVEGAPIIYQNKHYTTHDDALAALDDLPYRMAKGITIVQLIPRENG